MSWGPRGGLRSESLFGGLRTGLCASASFTGPSFFRNVPESALHGGQTYVVKFQVAQNFIFDSFFYPPFIHSFIPSTFVERSL